MSVRLVADVHTIIYVDFFPTRGLSAGGLVGLGRFLADDCVLDRGLVDCNQTAWDAVTMIVRIHI